MTEEYVDIVDAKGTHTGESVPISVVHEKGLPHRTVHIWIINSENKILLQKRSKAMRAYPNCWAMSASGHISSGQTSLEAAQKETEEELGLVLQPSVFKYLFTLKDHVVLNNNTYIDDEFQDVYLVRIEASVHVEPNLDEVSEVKWVTTTELASSITEKEYEPIAREEKYAKILEYIHENF